MAETLRFDTLFIAAGDAKTVRRLGEGVGPRLRELTPRYGPYAAVSMIQASSEMPLQHQPACAGKRGQPSPQSPSNAHAGRLMIWPRG
jgi:hypothetical protein